MVKKILNWTGSGIFRTLGRTIAYILIGLLVSLILNKIGFKLPSIFAMQVNASTKQSWAASQTRLVMDNHGTNTFTSWQNNPYTFTSLSYPVKHAQIRLRTSDGFNADNSYTFTLQYVPTPDSLGVQSIVGFKDGDLSQTENITCLQWVRSSSGLYSSECSFQPHSNYSSSQYFWVAITFFEEYQTSVTVGVTQYEERLGVSAVITNQTNMINNTLNNIDNTIKDDDVDDDSNDMADFLNDFTFEKDGSISSILTLPITFVENVFEGSYTDDLCFTFRGVQSCLPNGKILWQRSGRHDNLLVGSVGSEQINALKTFFQLVVGGYICYKLLMGIVRTYNTAIDPTIDMSVVMKL